MWHHYLKNLLTFHSNSEDLSEKETKLMSIVHGKVSAIEDDKIRLRVHELKKSKRIINVEDFGAGSKYQKTNERLVSEIAKYASIRPKYGQLFASIIEAFKLKKGVEFGTSFGIGTSYLASLAEHVITIEGCSETAKIAHETFKTVRLNNIDLRIGEFSLFLEELKHELHEPTFIYIDGNHQYKPTIQYFNYFEANAHQNSIMVFDDIYWSTEMKKAWFEIKQKPYFSIDLYKVGIVMLKSRSTPLSIRRRI